MKYLLSLALIVLFFLGNSAVYARENYDQYFEKMQSIDYEKNLLTIKSGDMKARYISNNYDITKADAIKITSGGKTQILPGLFDPKDPENQDRISCFNQNMQEEGATKEFTWNMCMSTFGGFIKFSPSGYYLEYIRNAWDYTGVALINTTSGKNVLQIDDPAFTGWTQDRKQFVYASAPGISSDGGLYITKRGRFPETKKLLNDPVIKAFISKNLIFIQTYETVEGYEQPVYKVVDLRNGKILFSKMGKKSSN